MNGLNTTEVRKRRAQGIKVKDRGRVPAALVIKFKEATASKAAQPAPLTDANRCDGTLLTCR